VLELWTLSHKMWLMIRNIYLKFEVDYLRNDKVIVKNILLHQNFNLKSGRGRRRGPNAVRSVRSSLNTLTLLQTAALKCVDSWHWYLWYWPLQWTLNDQLIKVFQIPNLPKNLYTHFHWLKQMTCVQNYK
jgi:hypothetical protein